MKISELFNLEVARSKGVEDYDSGSVPFVTNTTLNNGVVKFVEPYSDDKLFAGKTICISGLGYATLQTYLYLPKGNGGDSATILIPKLTMSIEELIFYTAIFNLQHNWRFSFGRKASKTRIESLEIDLYSSYNGSFNTDFENHVQLLRDGIEEYALLIER